MAAVRGLGLNVLCCALKVGYTVDVSLVYLCSGLVVVLERQRVYIYPCRRVFVYLRTGAALT